MNASERLTTRAVPPARPRAANRSASYVAAYRAIVRKYPEQQAGRILRDLVASTPGEGGKWFAAAKETGLL